MIELENAVKKVIGEQLGYPSSDIANHHDLVNDLGADSLDLVELVMALEDEFEVEITDEQCERIMTSVQAIIDFATYSEWKIPTRLETPFPVIETAQPTGVCADPKCEDCEGFDINYQPQYKQELRLYGFINHYLANGIHAGIQHGHAAVDLIRKYSPGYGVLPEQTTMVNEWADNHKTFIILNGGMHIHMLELKKLVEESGFPFAVFHESEEALAGVMTTVVVVLPDDIFNLRQYTNNNGEVCFSWSRTTDDGGVVIHQVLPGDKHYEFVKMLKSKGMAK